MKRIWTLAGSFLLSAQFGSRAVAGMPSFDLNDIVALRLEEISFFLAIFLLCAAGVRWMWNSLAKDFQSLPRLDYRKAVALSGLLGLLMLIVLTMISGARELLTPGAWRKQGATYRLNDPASEQVRRQSIESLRAALFAYAERHKGEFPPHDFTPEIPEKLWQAPDQSGTRYVYINHPQPRSGTNIVAFEPPVFGDNRLALFANGEIRMISSPALRESLQNVVK
jgi:hypothetical protein